MRNLALPNTVEKGEFSGGEKLITSALVIQGSVSQPGEVVPPYPEHIESDQYRFEFKKGDFVNAECISFVSGGDEAITGLRIFSEQDGAVLCENLQEFEGYDPLCFDVEISKSGTYVVEVFTTNLVCFPGQCLPLTFFSNGIELLGGTYDLLVYAIDKPGKKHSSNMSPVITSDAHVEVKVEEGKESFFVLQVEAEVSKRSELDYAIFGGADKDLFKMDELTGHLFFEDAPDAENPRDADSNNIYEVLVRATDHDLHFDDQVIHVTVSNHAV